MKNRRSALRFSPRPAGFTLLEVVVAIAVLAIALGVIYESLGWSIRRVDNLQHRQIAWSTAQSILSDIHGRGFLQIGSTTGRTSDQITWSMNVSEWPTRLSAAAPLRPFEVVIVAAWGERKSQSITLRSIEMAKVGP